MWSSNLRKEMVAHFLSNTDRMTMNNELQPNRQTLKEFCNAKIPHWLSVGTEHLKPPVQRQKKSNEDPSTSGLQYKAQSIPAPSQGRRQNCNSFNHPSICHVHYVLIFSSSASFSTFDIIQSINSSDYLSFPNADIKAAK